MNWYYTDGEKSFGPIDEKELEALVDKGRIDAETFVWNKNLPQWMPYGDVGIGGPLYVPPSETDRGKKDSTVNVPPKIYKCSVCGNILPEDDVTHEGDSLICSNCQPILDQMMENKAPDSKTTKRYGGFWIRLFAKFIDEFIVFSIAIALWIGIKTVIDITGDRHMLLAYIMVSIVVLISIDISLSWFFIGKYGSTPGKMAFGLKIVTSQGEAVNHGLASKRSIAEILSVMLLFIGYIMAAFDSEKRTLHDRICDTRVILDI